MGRYIELKGEHGERMVVDTKSIPFRVICVCSGYDAPFNCEEIINALEAFHVSLYSKFTIGEISSNG